MPFLHFSTFLYAIEILEYTSISSALFSLSAKNKSFHYANSFYSLKRLQSCRATEPYTDKQFRPDIKHECNHQHITEYRDKAVLELLFYILHNESVGMGSMAVGGSNQSRSFLYHLTDLTVVSTVYVSTTNAVSIVHASIDHRSTR